MTKIKKTYRLDADLIEQLQVKADKSGIKATEAIEDALRSYVEASDNLSDKTSDTCHTESHTSERYIATLEKQLTIKDEQISKLNEALLNAQQQGANAQALQGMNEARALLATADEKEDEQPSSWMKKVRRGLRRAFMGEGWEDNANV